MLADLSGLRVLDLSRYLPGPYCSLILADLGADVVRLEDTAQGDPLRGMPPLVDGMSIAFCALNRGKRSIALDLKQPAGHEAFLRLVAQADILVDGFRPRVLPALGLDHDTLRRHNPALIHCSISGYGQDGPLSDRAGHDINYQALAGLLAAGKQGAASVPSLQLADIVGGALWATIRILAALVAGQGAHLDVSITEGAMSLLLPWYPLMQQSEGQQTLEQLSGTLANYRLYRSSDGDSFASGALEEKFWKNLWQVSTGGADADTTPKMDELAQPAIAQTLEQSFAARASCHWRQALAAADTCTEPVLDTADLAQHPLHQQRRMFFQQETATGKMAAMRLPTGAPRALAPAARHGEHTVELLREAGFSQTQIAALTSCGIASSA